jgi:hypothetical protein
MFRAVIHCNFVKRLRKLVNYVTQGQNALRRHSNRGIEMWGSDGGV